MAACLGTASVCRAQAAPSDLSPDVQEVLTLSRQHMDDSVITNYIFSTGKAYKLSADDIIYLNGQGVSQPVISALLATSSNASAQPSASAAPAASSAPPTPDGSAPSATPPPVDDSSAQPDNSQPPSSDSGPSGPPPSEPPPGAAPMPMGGGPILDNFYTDGGLNPSLWTTQSPLLAGLAAQQGVAISPVLSFSPSGMQMSGIGGHNQFMGIQSTAAVGAPFSFSATVSGLTQDAVPFEIYLVSGDMSQYLTISGHLGGRGHPRGNVTLFGPFGGAVRIPTGGGTTPEFGVWVNHTGSGWPISTLGERLFNYPVAGVPYTVQVNLGPDGVATVTLQDANRGVLGVTSVPVGTGPFFVVLAGRDGPTYAEWQSVQLTPAGPPQVAEAAPAPEVPPTPTLDYFQGQLSPYGIWETLPGYGLVWQPAVGPGWRPYYDGGNWQYTDAGYYWQSSYPWGDIAFHYGRWAYAPTGWVWVPGYDYAPSWVVWRHDDADGYVGWAPLPPGAVFVDGGWMFHGGHVGVDFDFGLGVGFFTFVGYDHFWAPNYRMWVVPHDRVVFAFNHSVFIGGGRFDHGHFVAVGLPRDRMGALTHHDMHAVAVAQIRHQEEVHNAVVRNNDVHNFHAGGQPNAFGHSQGTQNGQHGYQNNQSHGGQQQHGQQGSSSHGGGGQNNSGHDKDQNH
jgi:hypothetical protein